MDSQAIDAIALSVRSLAIDAVETAANGHPGMPMGMAELGALLYGEVLKYDPSDPAWPDRDRFVLSAGHGSMFLYSLFHLAGFEVTLEDVKNFRRVGSKTPGHPEYGMTPGVETTTGPLGQGLSNAVGMAIAERMLAGRFNTDEHTVVDHRTYVIAGDGDLMEGITSEASSLAGHLELGKLIVMYDDNGISIEGPTDLAFTENVAARYHAYGWQVLECDAYDIESMRTLIADAQADTARPSLILLKSVIGKGSPNKAGTASAHGAPLGKDEVALTKQRLGLDPDTWFYIHPDATEYFKGYRAVLAQSRDEWKRTFDAWAQANPGLVAQWRESYEAGYKEVLKDLGLPGYSVGDKIATRKASGAALEAIAKMLPNVVGGSADLAPSNNTKLSEYGDFSRENPAGRTLHFGVREHAMAAIGNGLALHGGLRPFVATFLVFTDYLRPSLRLSSLMNVPLIYVMTHDSVYLGGDGPTHQPIEHLAALRAIPRLRVLRPADAEETNEAWLMALEHDGPTLMALTRQGVPVLEKADPNWRSSMRRGGYTVREARDPEVVVVATGSEVSLAVEAAEQSGRAVRVVSMTDRELFLDQDRSRREELLPAGTPVVVAEAAVNQGWEVLTPRERIFSINRFGESGPGNEVAEHLGFSVDKLAALIRSVN